MAVGSSTITVKVLGDASSLIRTLEGTEGVVATSMGNVGGHAKKAGDEMEGAGKKAEGAGKGFQSAGGGIATVMEGFAAVEVVKSLGEEFNKDQQATARLNSAMKDAGETAGGDFKDKLEEAVHAGEKLGFSATDTKDSIAALRLAGVDTARGMEAQAAIQDLARAKNISLADATNAVVKGMQGQGKALKDLNVEMPAHLATQAKADAAAAAAAVAHQAAGKAFANYAAIAKKFGEDSPKAVAAHTAYEAALNKATKADEAAAQAKKDVGDRTHQLGDILDIVSGKTKGQAAEAANTLSGRMNVLKTEALDMGTKLIEDVEPAISKVIDALGFMTDHADILLPILGTAVGLFVAWKTAMLIASVIEAVSTAVGGLNVVLGFLAANPIVLVILAVAAIVAALVILEMKFHFIEAALGALGDVFGGTFGAIEGFVTGAISFVGDHWQLILAILTGPFGLALLFIKDHLDTIEGFFKDLPGRLASALGGLAGAVGGVMKGAMDAMIWPINEGLKGMGDLGYDGKFGIPGFHVRDLFGGGMPQIPTFHSGGVVPGMPGSDQFILAKAGERVLAPGESDRVSGGGNVQVHVQANTNADPYEIAREIVWGLRFASR